MYSPYPHPCPDCLWAHEGIIGIADYLTEAPAQSPRCGMGSNGGRMHSGIMQMDPLGEQHNFPEGNVDFPSES